MSDGVALRGAFPLLLESRALINEPASYFECGSAVGRTTEKRLLTVCSIIVVGDNVDHATTLLEAKLELTGKRRINLYKKHLGPCAILGARKTAGCALWYDIGIILIR